MGAPMRIRSASSAAAAAEPRRAPVRRTEPLRAPLRVVPKRGRRLRTGPTVFLGGLLAFAIAFVLVVAQALLVQGQQQLDDLGTRIAEADRRQQELRLQVAQLESPSRIVAVATNDLGMVPPAGVTYLTPSGAVTVPGP
jgi:cell division protein FtsL